MADSETLYCYIHPDRETMLRCNNCERPICTSCAVQTPTGYRCKECVRGQQKKFETANGTDFLLAPLAAGVLSFIGSAIITRLGFFTLFLAPLAGTVIAGVAVRLTGRRRSKKLFYIIAGAVAAGALPLLLVSLFTLFAMQRGGGLNIYGLLPLIYQAAYIILCTGSAFYRMSGIRL